jgi:hypothetical protein
MRERVRQSHGELTIDSNALGTKIYGCFPSQETRGEGTECDFTTRRRLIVSRTRLKFAPSKRKGVDELCKLMFRR